MNISIEKLPIIIIEDTNIVYPACKEYLAFLVSQLSHYTRQEIDSIYLLIGNTIPDNKLVDYPNNLKNCPDYRLGKVLQFWKIIIDDEGILPFQTLFAKIGAYIKENLNLAYIFEVDKKFMFSDLNLSINDMFDHLMKHKSNDNEGELYSSWKERFKSNQDTLIKEVSHAYFIDDERIKWRLIAVPAVLVLNQGNKYEIFHDKDQYDEAHFWLERLCINTLKNTIATGDIPCIATIINGYDEYGHCPGSPEKCCWFAAAKKLLHYDWS